MSWLYSLREAVSALAKSRMSSFLSVVITAISLFFLGLFAVSVLKGWQVTHQLKKQIEMEVFLRDGVSDDLIYAMKLKLQKQPEIDSVVYVSKTAALRDFQREFGEDVAEILGENPLPASFRIQLNPRYLNPDDVRQLEEKIKGWRGVDEVIYRYDLLQAFEKYFRIAAVVAFFLGLLLIIASILLISNTIRLSILGKRDSIEIMSLVGAKPAFIRRPFVIEGAIQGFLGGLLAVLALLVLLKIVSLLIPGFRLDFKPVGWALIIWGTLIGTVGSWIAIRRLLRSMIF